jgi:hypothetical protein
MEDANLVWIVRDEREKFIAKYGIDIFLMALHCYLVTPLLDRPNYRKEFLKVSVRPCCSKDEFKVNSFCFFCRSCITNTRLLSLAKQGSLTLP